MYYALKIDDNIPQSKDLAPDKKIIINRICEFYNVTENTLKKSKRGEFNEARNVAIYLFRVLRHDSLNVIGESFGIKKYTTVSSVISRMKQLIKNDHKFRKRFETIKNLLNKRYE